MSSTPEKIAIIGGGIAGLVAAYELSRTPELRARYDITLYQLGWRLGGKLASGRDPAQADRNTEHGLHVWFGFYDNAFAVFKEVFARWRKPAGCPWRAWKQAFSEQSLTPVGETIDGQLRHWDLVWPRFAGEPGQGGLPTPGQVIRNLYNAVVDRIRDLLGGATDDARDRPPLPQDAGHLPQQVHDLYRDAVEEPIDFAPPTEGAPPAAGVAVTLEDLVGMADGWLEALAHDLESALERLGDEHLHGLIHVLHQIERTVTEHLLDRDDVDAHRLRNLVDVGLAFVCGLLNPAYGIWRNFDLDRINHLEFRQWLIENGGAPEIVKGWSVVRTVYDAFFQYRGGDMARPDYEAGTAARVFLRAAFTYKQAVLYLLDAGMGETVIGPMYDVLVDQGVKFEFFHKLRGVGLEPGKPRVASLTFERQAELRAGPYRPTLACGGLTCWPSEPLWDQLVDGDRLKAEGVDFESHWCQHRGVERVLRRGADFDRVLSAIDLGSFKPLNSLDRSIFHEILAASPRLRKLADALPMIPSVALQLWMRPSLEELGWTAGRPAMVTWAYPQDVWADMSAVLRHESWTGPDAPRSLHYFCGVWGEQTDLFARPSTAADTPAVALADVTRRTFAQFDRYVGTIWPRAVAQAGGLDRALVRSQYVRANVDPAECCVGSPTATAHLRPRAHESGIDGLVLCGNWVRNGLNSTCVEQATMTGMAAARFISGAPIEIVGEYFLARRPDDRAISPAPPPPTPPVPTPTPPPDLGAARGLPRYVSSVGHGEQVMSPPGQVLKARVYAFAVPADRNRLTAFARRYLAAPTGGALEYTAIAPFVLCTYLRSDFLTSTSEEVGTIADRECGLWMVLLEKPRGLAPPRLVFWMPYIVIDSSIGMATGREIWGFRKEVGALTIPGAADDPARFVAQATIFRTLSTHTRGRLEPLIRVERETPPGPLERAWESIDDVGAYFAERLIGGTGAWFSRWTAAASRILGRAGLRLSPAFRPGVTVVNLKQFRDAADPNSACYQSVVSSPLQITKIHGGGPLLGDYWLRITRCESHQIVSDLGLPDEETRVAFGGWLDVDMLALAGTELWRAG